MARSWILSVALVGAISGVALASGGPGTPAQNVKNKPGASADEKAYAKCICDLIEGNCLSDAVKKKAVALKKAGCVKIATKADLTSHYTADARAILGRRYPNASPAELDDAAAESGTAVACGKFSKPGKGAADSRATAINENAGWFALLYPNPFGQGNNEYVKKSAVNDEVMDMIGWASLDKALKKWGGGGGDPAFGQNFEVGKKVYVNLKSAISDMELLGKVEPQAPPAGASQAEQDAHAADHKLWVDALNLTNTILVKYKSNLCEVIKWFKSHGKGPAQDAQIKLLDDCKADAATCLANHRDDITGNGLTPAR